MSSIRPELLEILRMRQQLAQQRNQRIGGYFGNLSDILGDWAQRRHQTKEREAAEEFQTKERLGAERFASRQAALGYTRGEESARQADLRTSAEAARARLNTNEQARLEREARAAEAERARGPEWWAEGMSPEDYRAYQLALRAIGRDEKDAGDFGTAWAGAIDVKDRYLQEKGIIDLAGNVQWDKMTQEHVNAIEQNIKDYLYSYVSRGRITQEEADVIVKVLRSFVSMPSQAAEAGPIPPPEQQIAREPLVIDKSAGLRAAEEATGRGVFGAPVAANLLGAYETVKAILGNLFGWRSQQRAEGEQPEPVPDAEIQAQLLMVASDHPITADELAVMVQEYGRTEEQIRALAREVGAALAGETAPANRPTMRPVQRR